MILVMTVCLFLLNRDIFIKILHSTYQLCQEIARGGVMHGSELGANDILPVARSFFFFHLSVNNLVRGSLELISFHAFSFSFSLYS